MLSNDEKWMRHALNLAKAAENIEGTNPIGCVIALNGELIADGVNEVDLRFDPTAHAEIITIRKAGQKLQNNELRNAVLYTTLQPCGMCAMASIWAKIGRIVFGAGRDDVHKMYFEDRHMDSIDFICDAYRDDLVMHGGVLKAECTKLYVPPNASIPESEQFNR